MKVRYVFSKKVSNLYIFVSLSIVCVFFYVTGNKAKLKTTCWSKVAANASKPDGGLGSIFVCHSAGMLLSST